MPLRYHPITGDAIVFAPDRALRPNAFGDDDASTCPFCPGNEHMTPPEISRRGDPWQIRVVPNKYPAVDGHEVIIESPQHEGVPVDPASTTAIVETWIERYRAHAADRHVAIFRNFGARAGASLEHVHSQIMPVSFLPPRIARESAAFAEAAHCPLCREIAAHRDEGLIISENSAFVWLAPRGSSHAHEQWIAPIRHVRDIDALEPHEIPLLAALLARSAAATLRIASSANTLLLNFPRERKAHFYIDVFPRTTPIAGFELGTGTFIDIIDPAAAVRALR